VYNLTDAKKRLYKFLVGMNRLTSEEYENIVGEPYKKENIR